MRPSKSTCVVQMKMRMPQTLHDQIVTSADRHMRAYNAEIIWRLARSFEDYPVPAADAPVEMEP